MLQELATASSEKCRKLNVWLHVHQAKAKEIREKVEPRSRLECIPEERKNFSKCLVPWPCCPPALASPRRGGSPAESAAKPKIRRKRKYARHARHARHRALLKTFLSVMMYSARRLSGNGTKAPQKALLAFLESPIRDLRRTFMASNLNYTVTCTCEAEHAHEKRLMKGERSSRQPLRTVVPLPDEVHSAKGSSKRIKTASLPTRFMPLTVSHGLSQCIGGTSNFECL